MTADAAAQGAAAGMASILLLVPARRLGINGFTGIVPALFSEAEPARCRDRWLR